MWNHALYPCFVLNAFKWDKMSVWRWIKACENRREAKKLKSICKVSLSIWHLEKRCHGEVSQDILWRLKKSAEVNRFELSCVFTKYKTLVWSATKIELLRKSLLISIFWQNQHAIETKIICTCVHLNSAAWFLTFVILNIHDSHHESKPWWSQAFPDISSPHIAASQPLLQWNLVQYCGSLLTGLQTLLVK